MAQPKYTNQAEPHSGGTPLCSVAYLQMPLDVRETTVTWPIYYGCCSGLSSFYKSPRQQWKTKSEIHTHLCGKALLSFTDESSNVM